MMKVFGVDFIEGDKNYDIDDVDAMKGTFWYDPVAFIEGINRILKKRYFLLGKKSLKNEESSNNESSDS